MKYENRELLQQLAAEYVLGTLRGRARNRFEKLLTTRTQAQAAVRLWEDRLVGLAASAVAEAPPKHVWASIEKRLAIGATAPATSPSASPGFFARLFGSRVGLGALAAVAVFAVAVALLVESNRTEPLQTIAVIAQAERGDLWRVQTSKDGSRIFVQSTERVARDAAHAFELWALPTSGAAPVSLGVLPTSGGTAVVVLSAAQQAALGGSSKIAVSLEPPGGSPTGAPTGPVLHVADLTKVG
jgi:anti-sigma-K factor RskA